MKLKAASIALGVLAYGSSALLLFTSGYLIAKTAQPFMVIFAVLTPIAWVQLFGITKPLARYAERLLSHQWVFKETSRLRGRLFKAARVLEANSSTRKDFGTYASLLSQDIEAVQNLYLRGLFPLIIGEVVLALAAIFAGWFSLPLAAMFVLVFFIGAVGVPAAVYFLTFKPFQKLQKLEREATRSLFDNLSGATDWHLAGRSLEVLEQEEASLKALQNLSWKLRLVVRSFELLLSLALVLALLGVIWLVYFQGLESCFIVAFALGFFPLIETAMLLPAASALVAAKQSNYSELSEIEQLAATEESAAASSASPVESAQPHRSTAAAKQPAPQPFVVSLNPDAQLWLSRICPGESLAIIGPSGAGKTTLLTMLPLEGSVAVLDQTPHIFRRSLRDNLRILAPDATDEQLIGVIDAVGLMRKFQTLPLGLDSMLEDGTVGFSGGEAHRLALARLLVSGCEVIVLDEPFSALDPKTEAAILEMLLQVFAHKTLIVVTHHLALATKFSKLMVIEQGRATYWGTPEAVFAESDYWNSLRKLDSL